MGVIATDNFNRADANPIGGNWTTTNSESALKIVSNQVQNSTDNADCGAFWNANSFPNDQYSQAVLVAVGNYTTDDGPGVAVRMASGARTYYRTLLRPSTDLITQKEVAGSFTHLSTITAAGAAAGDTLYLDVQSSTLTIKRNGTTAGTTTDSAVTAGAAGLEYSSEGAAQTSTWDTWEGGDFVTSIPNKVVRVLQAVNRAATY